MPKFIVAKTDAELSPLEFLQRSLPAAPSSYLKQLLKKGKVLTADGPLAIDSALPVGGEVELPDSGRVRELLASTAPAVAPPLTILYESREILVVDKPAGVAIHASKGHETENLTDLVAALLRQRGAPFKIAPIHRLDLETSGPVLFGKGRQACGRLGQMFMRREVAKFYQALVTGQTAGSGQLQSTLLAKGKPKEACTEFRALARNDRASLLELQLQTGRQHQIRRQLAAAGHPLYGDRRYRGPCPQQLPRLFLHCCRLVFVDPFSAAPIEITSPLPAELRAFLPQCGLQLPELEN